MILLTIIAIVKLLILQLVPLYHFVPLFPATAWKMRFLLFSFYCAWKQQVYIILLYISVFVKKDYMSAKINS